MWQFLLFENDIWFCGHASITQASSIVKTKIALKINWWLTSNLFIIDSVISYDDETLIGNYCVCRSNVHIHGLAIFMNTVLLQKLISEFVVFRFFLSSAVSMKYKHESKDGNDDC